MGLKKWKHINVLMLSQNKEALLVDDFDPTLRTEVEKVFRSFILSNQYHSVKILNSTKSPEFQILLKAAIINI